MDWISFYTFHRPAGAEVINNWDTQIEPEHPLFKVTGRVLRRYQLP